MKPAVFGLALLVFVAVSCGGRSASNGTVSSEEIKAKDEFVRTDATDKYEAALTTMNVDDGISLAEAQLIANSYFARNVGCGGFTGIRDGEGVWHVEGKFGYAAQPIKDFAIDKTSGEVKSSIGHSYKDPKTIFDR